MSKSKSGRNRSVKRKGYIFGFSFLTVLAAVLVIGSTVALLYVDTPEKANVFVPGEVDCEVEETFDGIQKTSIKVQSTGNTAGYIRVTFTSHYAGENGNIIGETCTVPEITLAADWVQGADGYYYYRYPVAPGALTGELLGAPMVLGTLKDGNGKVIGNQVVNVFAETVQSSPTAAVVESWDAVVGVAADTSLLVKARVLENHSVSELTKYRTVQKTSTNVPKEYSNGVFNDGSLNASEYIAPTDSTSVASGNGIDESEILLYFELYKFVEITEIKIHFDDLTNLDASKPVQAYVADGELLYTNSLTAAVEDGVCTLKYNYTAIGKTIRLEIPTTQTGSAGRVSIKEVEIWGYLTETNYALDATYKGDSSIIKAQIPAVNNAHVAVSGANAATEDMTAFHKGFLNDGKICSRTYNPDWSNKMEISSNSTDGTVSLVFKFDTDTHVQKVDVMAGVSDIARESENNQNVVHSDATGETYPTRVDVYVGNGETAADCILLGSTTFEESNLYASATTLYDYSVINEAGLAGQYVVIVLHGIEDSSTVFGINEVQFWSDSVLAAYPDWD